jgi:hypothetical protein
MAIFGKGHIVTAVVVLAILVIVFRFGVGKSLVTGAA